MMRSWLPMPLLLRCRQMSRARTRRIYGDSDLRYCKLWDAQKKHQQPCAVNLLSTRIRLFGCDTDYC